MASLSSWTEAILFGILLLTGLGIMVASMNSTYQQNQDSGFGVGFQNDANTTLANFKTYQSNFEKSINTGTASFTSVFGLVLSTSYDILFSTIKLLFTFVSGAWIVKAVVLMNLPVELGLILQLFYLLVIGYALLQILFRPSRI